jgi:hypothetical protein
MKIRYLPIDISNYHIFIINATSVKDSCLFKILIFDFGIVPTVWYFFVSFNIYVYTSISIYCIVYLNFFSFLFLTTFVLLDYYQMPRSISSQLFVIASGEANVYESSYYWSFKQVACLILLMHVKQVDRNVLSDHGKLMI